MYKFSCSLNSKYPLSTKPRTDASISSARGQKAWPFFNFPVADINNFFNSAGDACLCRLRIDEHNDCNK